MHVQKINEISLRKLNVSKSEIYRKINSNFKHVNEIQALLLEILNEIKLDTNDTDTQFAFSNAVGDCTDIKSVKQNFTKFLKYLEKTQSDEVLTKINKILNSENGDIVFNLLDYDYVTKPKTKEELIKTINQFIRYYHKTNINLNTIDVSAITDMSELFKDSDFNGDISKWDVSNVKDMALMFQNSDFNGDISKWDVSNVRRMDWMFDDSKFNQNISKWDVSQVVVNTGFDNNCPLKNKLKYQPKFKN